MASKRARNRFVDLFRLNLRRLMDARGLTIRSLAPLMDTSYVHVSRVLMGHQKPTLTWMGKAADALGVEMQEFFEPILKEPVDAC